MIVINDDSSDDDEFKPLPSLLRAVASPIEVRDDDDATRRDAKGSRRALDEDTDRDARPSRASTRSSD